MAAPNDTWAADFKGEFKTRDGRYCYPLTITDGYSRFLLACRGRLSTRYEVARPGIQPVLIQPGRPDQNGRHERMHRTLGPTTRPPARNLAAQQRRFSQFITEYNEVRPHRALAKRTPSELYTSSPRPYPSRAPQVDYPAHFETRKADVGGRISWHDRPLRVSKILHGELVGLEPVEEHLYRVYFGPLLLGVFNERTWQIHA